MELTWGEFKKLVEEKGVTDEMEIHYIDITFPNPAGVDVYPATKKEGIVINQ